MDKAKIRKIGKITLDILLYIFLAICIFAVFVTVLSKRDSDGAAEVFGYQMRVVTSDSMSESEFTDVSAYKIKDIPIRSMVFVKVMPDDPAEVGIAKVASNLVSYEYLWSEIRVKGGAYGAGMSALRTGQTSFYSYRDPSPKRSIDVIKKSAEFLRDAANRGANIDKYIIGAIGDTSPYLTPRSRANVGTQRYLLGVTDEIRRRTKEEILSADPEKILRYAEKLEAAAENAAYCIVAPKDKLDSEALDIILEV